MNAPANCSKCGTPIAPGQRFCAGCGADVSGQQGNVATAFVPKQDMVRATMSQTALHDVVRHATIGEYEILAELGRGGMATVYLGHDIALDRKVAIKVMSPALLTGDGMVERFKREARTAASLSHPNIIPIYAVKEGDQIVYFVMKFVEGRPLDSIIKETGKLPIQMVQQILQQVGAGLGYAHKRGIIHRDVKPANVMVDTEGWAVVTDFGIAKVTETKGLTMTGATVGTPSYMSPEQCAAKELTGASDQYSLGVMAYEMLAGKLPFNADSIMAIMYSHFNDPPPPIDEVRPDCPPEIVTAVMRMLAKEPADRFPTVEDAISAIGVPAMTPDDPVRTQLMTLAASNKNTEMLKRLTTPVSMPGRTQAGKATVSTTGGTGFGIVPQQVSVAAGGAVQLTAKLKGTGGKTLVGPRVTWASTAPEIATITPQGLVNAIAEGEVLITCTCEGASATATITVTPAEGHRSKKGLFIGGGILVAAGIALAVLKPWAPKPTNDPNTTATQQQAVVPPGTPPKTDSNPASQVAQNTPPANTPAQSKPSQPSNPAHRPGPTAGRPSTVAAKDTPKTVIQVPVQTTPQTQQQQTKPEPAPVTTPAPAPTPPQPQPILASDIAAVIATYETAIESGKLDRVRAAYPGMTPAQADQWSGLFQDGKNIKATYKLGTIQPAVGDQATVSVTGTLQFDYKGKHQETPLPYTASLTRTGGTWRLEAVR
ncbi:MAG TPA: protein kinase [Gemmatimonadales bacterium]|nr:protein kinase [Gemmatimonadales bacterium]